MPDFNPPLGCPSSTPRLVEREGVGYGATKSAALSSARGQADTRISLHVDAVTCNDGCTKTVQQDPPFDKQEPGYDREGAGWKCTVSRQQRVTIECKAAGASVQVQQSGVAQA
ncbi:MAG: hypothetical protein AB1Z98_34840 [Nannocystaceae bacterium]